MHASHFPLILHLYFFGTLLWKGENRERQTIMVKRSLKSRNAYSFYFNSVIMPHFNTLGGKILRTRKPSSNQPCISSVMDIFREDRITQYLASHQNSYFTHRHQRPYPNTLSLQHQFNQILGHLWCIFITIAVLKWYLNLVDYFRHFIKPVYNYS